MGRFFASITGTVFLLVAACSSDEPMQSNPGTELPAQSVLPNLSSGPHIGYIVGFDSLNTEQMTAAENRFAESVAAGMSISRVQLDWQELEPEPGVYDNAPLTEALQGASRSDLQPFFTLSTLDSDGLTFPTDLMSENQSLPAEGLSLDGPEITTRFRNFLTWLIPELEVYNVWGLSLANESSTQFDRIDQQVITRFLTEAAEHANALTDQIGITVTFAGGHENDTPKVTFISDLLPHLDMLTVNYYCLDSLTLNINSSTDWQADFDTLVSRAQNKPVFFQELGCPAGLDSAGDTENTESVIGATVANQTDFFEFALSQIENRDQLRAATVFQLNDWSPELAALIAEPLQDEGAGDVADKLIEWLSTVGLCRWSDGQCRPAYQVFLASASRMAVFRMNP